MKKPSDFMTEEKLELYARNLLDEVVNSKLLEVCLPTEVVGCSSVVNLVNVCTRPLSHACCFSLFFHFTSDSLQEGIRLALERKNQLKSLVVFAFNHAIDSTNPAHRVCLGQLLGSLIKTSGVLSAVLSG